MTAICVGSFNT